MFVAPLRFGAGMKGKIGESLAHGLPVVTTDLGAEGMGLVNERDILIANTAEAFAGMVARCYSDEKLWTRVAISGRRTMVRRYAPSTVARPASQVPDRARSRYRPLIERIALQRGSMRHDHPF